MRSLRSLLILVALPLVVPTGAQASTIFGGVYTASPSEQNHLTISYDPTSGNYTFEDSGVSTITDTDGVAGCSVSGNTATCPGAFVEDTTKGIVVMLGDRNDSATITTTVPGPSEPRAGGPMLIGGPGNDTLVSGPGRPYVGTVQTLGDAGLWGDGGPYDPYQPGGGNDLLIGGAGNDGLIGQAGNDVERGSGGSDLFDGTPFFFNPRSVAESYAAGSDLIDGGPGSDMMSGLEPMGATAQDQMLCGTGDEQAPISAFFPGRDPVPGDEVVAGAGDSVSDDCEAIVGAIACPRTADSACVGESVVEGKRAAAAPGQAAAASARQRKVTIGKGHFKVPPGRLIPVRVPLKRKRVRKVLGHHGKAAAREKATAHVGKRRIKLGRTRFVLKRR